MILTPEKSQGPPDTTDGNTEAQPSSLVYLTYQPESASSSRAIAPSSPPENVPPPSYSNDSADHAEFAHERTNPAMSPSSSYYAPASSTAAVTMPVPMVPGRPPAPFSRVPSRDLMYPSFQPIFLVATGKTLDKGFPNASPPSNSIPHPFVSHDVTEGDWISFLQEARMAAILTDKQIQMSHLPIVSIIPIVNSLASYGMKQIMKSRNTTKVIDCIDRWNRHFFELRKLKVVLMKGPVRVSGQKEFNDTYTSRNPEYDQKQEYPPSSSTAGISQELMGKNDDIFRLFVVPLS